MFEELKRMPKRQLLLQSMSLDVEELKLTDVKVLMNGYFLSAGLIITSALMIWKTLILVSGSESPVVVVLSGSMEPGFYRGDILFLNQPKKPLTTGDIVVYNANEREIPIVHRIVKVHQRSDDGSDVSILTKGDNNFGDDRSLYPPGMLWLDRSHIMGRVNGLLPYLGRMTILFNDFPFLKYAMIAILGFFVLTSKE